MAAKTSTKSTTKRNTKRPPAPSAETMNVETTTTETTTASTMTADTMTTSARTPSRDEIARRAYELFLSRGRQHGRAQEDWLTAESELRARHAVN